MKFLACPSSTVTVSLKFFIISVRPENNRFFTNGWPGTVFSQKKQPVSDQHLLHLFTGFTQIFPVHIVLFLTINRYTIPTNKGQVTTDLDKLAVYPLQGLGIVLPEIGYRLVTRAGILA